MRVVLHDWIHLRRTFRGRIQVIWVMERRRRLGCRMDACGDLFVDKWEQITKETVQFAHRLIGWKRSSCFVRNQLVSKAYWMSTVYRSCS